MRIISNDKTRTRPGVYVITCLPTGECYVGGSRCVHRRFQQHRYDLRRGDHNSQKLQEAWALHGELAFSFGYVVKCSVEDILRYEQFYIDKLQPEFNTHKLATSGLGTKRSEQTKARLRGRPQSTAARHDFEGEMLTAQEIGDRTGLTLVAVYARLRNGVPLTRAKQNGCPEPVDVGGELLTPRQIAAKHELPLTTIYSRLRAGKTGKELVAPRSHRGRNSRD